MASGRRPDFIEQAALQEISCCCKERCIEHDEECYGQPATEVQSARWSAWSKHA